LFGLVRKKGGVFGGKMMRLELGLHTYDLNTWEAEAFKFKPGLPHELEKSLGYIGRLCLKKLKPTKSTKQKPEVTKKL
jgi:hypothetical protein